MKQLMIIPSVVLITMLVLGSCKEESNELPPGSPYIPIATIPAKGSAAIIDFSTNGDRVDLDELDGSRDVEILDDYDGNRCNLDGWLGTAGSPYRFYGNGNKIGGPQMRNAQKAITTESYTGNDNNYVEFYQHWLVKKGIGFETNGLFLDIPDNDDAVFVVQDCIFDLAGITIHANTVNSNKYESVTCTNIISINDEDSSGENFYMGSTSKNPGTYSMYNNTNFTDIFALTGGWDAIQFNGHYNLKLNRFTALNYAHENRHPQTYGIQAQNVSGTIENGIIYSDNGFGDGLILAGHDLTIRNVTIYITKDNGWNFVQRLSSQYPGEKNLNNRPIQFIDCHFVYEGTWNSQVPFRIDEDQCDVNFIRCKFYDDGNINVSKGKMLNKYVSDQRGDKNSYDINFVDCEFDLDASLVPVPTFTTIARPATWEDRENFGLVTEPFYYELGQGYRTPLNQ